MKNNNDSTKNKKLLSLDNQFMVDAELLPLFDKARNGCLDSQLKLIIAFNFGEGAKKNEAIESELEVLIFNTADSYKLKLAALWNPAIREYEKGNFDAMKAQFHLIIDFMQENVPMEKWDFSLFRTMERLSQSERE